MEDAIPRQTENQKSPKGGSITSEAGVEIRRYAAEEAIDNMMNLLEGISPMEEHSPLGGWER